MTDCNKFKHKGHKKKALPAPSKPGAINDRSIFLLFIRNIYFLPNKHFQTHFDTMKPTPPLKTREQVKAEFKAAGIAVAEWARNNKFSRMTVVEVLRGSRQGLRGEAHRCAVALGLKEGVVVEVASFKPAAKRRAKTIQAQAEVRA